MKHDPSDLANRLTKAEARQYTKKIIGSEDSTRQLIYEMDSRGGYEVLGYKNIRDYSKHFGMDQSSLYRQLAAAKVEVNLGVKINTYREGSIRALAKLSPENQVLVFDEWQKKHPDPDVPTAEQLAEILQSEGLIKPKESPTNDEKVQRVLKEISSWPTGKSEGGIEIMKTIKKIRAQFMENILKKHDLS